MVSRSEINPIYLEKELGCLGRLSSTRRNMYRTFVILQSHFGSGLNPALYAGCACQVATGKPPDRVRGGIFLKSRQTSCCRLFASCLPYKTIQISTVGLYFLLSHDGKRRHPRCRVHGSFAWPGLDYPGPDGIRRLGSCQLSRMILRRFHKRCHGASRDRRHWGKEFNTIYRILFSTLLLSSHHLYAATSMHLPIHRKILRLLCKVSMPWL